MSEEIKKNEAVDTVKEKGEVDTPQIKEHSFSLVDSFFEFAVLVAGILYTVWNCVDLVNAIAEREGFSVIVSSAFSVVAKAVPFIILLVILECHEKLSYIEDNLSMTTDYIVDYNNHLDSELEELHESLGAKEDAE